MLLAVSLLLFGTMNVLPGGPRRSTRARISDPATIAYVRRNLGLDQPLPVQYVSWVAAAARGDLGRSFGTGSRCSIMIARAAAATLQLTGGRCSWRSPSPSRSASSRRSPAFVARHAPRACRFLGLSFPSFWLGIMLILLFSGVLGWLPALGDGDVRPRDGSPLAAPARRAAHGDARRRCRSRRSCGTPAQRPGGTAAGLRPHGAGQGPAAGMGGLGHALRNALIPVVTLVGLSLPTLVGGAVLTETVFAWPGHRAAGGRCGVRARLPRDHGRQAPRRDGRHPAPISSPTSSTRHRSPGRL